jgi:signal transduction histidine kinase
VDLSLLSTTQGLFKYQSGRVISLGRVMLAILFLLAVFADRSEPDRSFMGTYGALILYSVGAIGIAAITWRNWWLDARLAVAMHAFDMAVFTAIVFSTNGATRPFFLFVVLPLLSAAIRWGWRETALTAAVLIALFLGAGFLLAGTEGWQPERIVVRSGHLIILSLLLIWFGIHQNFSRLFFQAEDIDAKLENYPDPLARALGLAMAATRASGGAMLIAPTGDEANDGLTISGGQRSNVTLSDPIFRSADAPAFLFDIPRDRLLSRRPNGSFRFAAASSRLSLNEAARLGLSEGLAARVITGTQQGWLVLWGIPDLSCDFIDLGRELGRATGGIIDRHALLQAIEISTAARTRLGLARDVHDSIVQFLAGAAFRVEAIKRSATSGNAVNQELDELKRLLVEEQGEIRGFLLALRRERELDLGEALAELRVLAERLSQQWSVDCNITAKEGRDSSIPIRLQLDLHQILREAVANAVRHGGADRVDVDLAIDDDHLELRVADNGSGFARTSERQAVEPRSIKERVERAQGSLRLVTAPGSTNLLISVPLTGAAA